MSETVLRNVREFAKRTHKQPCAVTGLPVVPGDLYVECVYADGREISRFKALAIICDCVNEAWPHYEWADYQASEGLWEWLCEHLGYDEARLCSAAAIQFWNSGRL